MKIGVIGATGLLGSTLIQELPGAEGILVDITKPRELAKVVPAYDIIINCAGIVPKNSEIHFPAQAFLVNSVGPRNIVEACKYTNTKVIHISSDCIFGSVLDAGPYDEDVVPVPVSRYEITKYVGEITDAPHVTVRTSFVGLPDPRGRGLLYWLLKERGKPVTGYTNALWNGLTTYSLARKLQTIINDDIVGIVHLHHQDSMSKADLLEMVNSEFNLGCTITRIPEGVDRRLSSKYPKYIETTSYIDLIREVKEKYEQFTSD